MKIGIVDLDTSHALHWIPLLREMGHDVCALHDGGAVHSPDYVHQFAQQHNIARVCEHLDEMADVVDCAVLLGVNWNRRLDQVRPFIEAEKSVLIDKPVAGNPADLRQLSAWIDGGKRISGGSSLRFCNETRNWLAQSVEERGTPHTVLCGCGNDAFFYGIHAAAMLHGIMGSCVSSVRHLGNYPGAPRAQRRIQINWPDGRTGVLVIGQTESWMNFFTCIITEKSATQFRTDAGKLYRALFESTLPFLSGEMDVPPLCGAEFIEPELCLLAARYSWMNGDCEVPLADLTDDAGYDSREFLATYKYF